MSTRMPLARALFLALAFAAVIVPGCSDSHEGAGRGAEGTGGGSGDGGGAGGGLAFDPTTCGGCMTLCQEVTAQCDATCGEIAGGGCDEFCAESSLCDQLCAAADQACDICAGDPPPGSEELCANCALVSSPFLCTLGCKAECPTTCAQAEPLCAADLCQQASVQCEAVCPCDDGGVGPDGGLLVP